MYIGIDLGGTNIVAGLVNEKNEIVVKETVKTNHERGTQAVIDDIAMLCGRVCELANVPRSEIKRIGIGTPGSVDHARGMVIFANNLGFDHVPMRDMLSKHWPKTPIYVENDANAAALGEFAAGAGRDHSSLICITLGTGVGGGIVLDGKIVVGFNGAAGEVGHHTLVMDGEPCSCGRSGCWESYASATALIAQTKKAMDEHRDSAMWSLAEERGKVNGRTSFDAMRMGDAAGKAVVDRYLRYVAGGIVNLINILQPEVLCIGGGIAGEGQSLLDALEPLVAPQVYKCDGKMAKLILAELGNDAGVIGAAILGD